MRINTKTGDINLTVEYKPNDLWVGVYWKNTKSVESKYRKLDIYICLLPMLPIHIILENGWR